MQQDEKEWDEVEDGIDLAEARDATIEEEEEIRVKQKQQLELSDYEEIQAKNAHHRALIMRILKDFPNGLTTQQILSKEIEYFHFSFLTDNRLRELRQLGWVKSEKGEDKLLRWKRVE